MTTGKRDHADAFEIWGLTGGIASGKSTVGRYLSEAGLPVIDADQIARELALPGGRAHGAIIQRFATDDRKKLREIVFADPAARKDLEAILHPLIAAESLERMQASGAPLIIYEAALLVETGRYKSFAGLIVVDAPREERLKRLMLRDGTSPELAERILDSQIPDQDRRDAATILLLNHGNLSELRARTLALVKKQGW